MEKYDTEKHSTHVQREVELTSPELSMIEKGPNKQYIEIGIITFQMMIL